MCTGTLRPLPACREYQFRLEYRVPKKPKVWIEDPPLVRRSPDEPIPHTYGDDRPCLFYPSEFRSDQLLARTIIPWLMEWLVFYEAWLATGVWLGGGIDHGGNKREQ